MGSDLQASRKSPTPAGCPGWVEQSQEGSRWKIMRRMLPQSHRGPPLVWLGKLKAGLWHFYPTRRQALPPAATEPREKGSSNGTRVVHKLSHDQCGHQIQFGEEMYGEEIDGWLLRTQSKNFKLTWSDFYWSGSIFNYIYNSYIQYVIIYNCVCRVSVCLVGRDPWWGEDEQQLELFSIRKLLCLQTPVGVAKDRKSWQQGRGSQ